MLRWVDPTLTSYKWLVQCVSYLAQPAELQMRSWVQQHYPQVGDEEFTTIWCLQTRSDYYEKALKTYVIQALENVGAPPARKEISASQGLKGLGSLTEKAPAKGSSVAVTALGTFHSSSPVAAAAAAHPQSPAAAVNTTTPVTKAACGVEPVCRDDENISDEDMDCHGTVNPDPQTPDPTLPPLSCLSYPALDPKP
jgi:hypothetical protein